MASYVNDLRLKEIATGDEDGTWGTSTNNNLSLIADAFGYGTKAVAADANETFTMPDATADGTRAMYLKLTSGVSLTATRTVTLAPNTVSKVWLIENATSGSQSITISQGSGATVTIATGAKAIIYTDGAGATAAVVLANPTILLGSGVSGVLPVANGGTGITSFGAGVATFLGTPSSANLATAVTDETGTGALVFATSPTLVTPALGTPASGVATNLTGTAAGLTAGNVTTNANLTGAVTSTGNATLLGSFSSANLAGALTDETGSGAAVFATSPTLVTPALGTPSSGTVTNLTGTASININGTVGATTPGTGAFTTISASGEIAANGGIALGDNDKATFGASDDLQIYHDGSNSYIDDVGTGNLLINADSLRLRDTSGNPYLLGNVGAEVRLYHAGLTKLATTATGIDVTGTVTADGLTVDSGISNVPATFKSTDAYALIQFEDNTTSAEMTLGALADDMVFRVNAAERLRITSAGLVGIGTSSPGAKVDVSDTTGPVIRLTSTSTAVSDGDAIGLLQFYGSDASAPGAGVKSKVAAYAALGSGDGSYLTFSTSDGVTNDIERLRIDSSGNVGIGTSSPVEELHITAAIPTIRLEDSDDGSRAEILYNVGSGGLVLRSDQGSSAASTSNIIAVVDAVERLRITSAGLVGIGTATPEKPLHVNSGTGNIGVRVESSNATSSVEFMDSGTTSTALSPRIGGISDDLFVQTSGVERLRVTSTGLVGIGNNAPGSKLEVADFIISGSEASGTTGSIVIRSRETSDITRASIGSLRSSGAAYFGRSVEPSTTVASGFNGGLTGTIGGGAWVINSAGETYFTSFPSAAMTKGSALSMQERMRITSAGDLLVGKTATAIGTEGVEARATGFIRATVDSADVLQLNRLSTDGDIIDFRKDGTTVGSIGTNNSDLFIGTTNGADECYLRFAYAGTGITPATAAGAINDAALDLGSAAARFKDLYLSGTVSAGAGTALLPTFTPTGDTNTGVWFPAADTIAASTAGVERLRVSSTGIDVTGTATMDGLVVDGKAIDVGTAPEQVPLNQYLGDLAFQSAEAVVLSGGTINATAIGATTPSTGAFTTLSASGEIAANGGITLGDNVKATFGGGDDLAVFSTGNNGYVENETGLLILRNKSDDSDIALQSDDGAGGITNYLLADGSNGALRAYHYGAEKLATTATGIDVTGTITADGLTVDGEWPVFTLNDTRNINIWADGDVVGELKFTSADTAMTNPIASIRAVHNRAGTGHSNSDAGLEFYTSATTSGTLAKRISIESVTGDVSFYEPTGTTPKLFWDASAESLTLSGAGGLSVTGTITTAAGTALLPTFTPTGDTNTGVWFPAADTIAASTAGVERLRITNGGGLLIGKTSTSGSIVGSSISASGLVRLTASEIAVAEINRLVSDGSIIDLKKDGVTVGTLGVVDGDNLYIATDDTTDCGIKFNGDSQALQPCSASGGDLDAQIKLGASGTRFTDLYLSGGVYLGGTGAANLLSDYETGTFTPTVVGTTTAGTGTYGSQSGTYTKVGRLVSFSISLSWSAHTGTGNIHVAGLPFTQSGTRLSYSVTAENLVYTGALCVLNVGANTLLKLSTQATAATIGDVAMDTDVSYLVITGTYAAA